MKRLTDTAWALIVRGSTAGVRGKVFFMSRSTAYSIMQERRRTWNPADAFFLYSLPVRYDDSMPHGHITLELP